MSASAVGQRNQHGRSSRARGQQLNKHVPYCLGVVLSGGAKQSVRTLECLRSLHYHFPVVICTRTRQLTPATRPPHHSAHVRHRQESPCVLERRPILHLDRHCHVLRIVQIHQQLFP